MHQVGDEIPLVRYSQQQGRQVTLGAAVGIAPADVAAGALLWRGNRAWTATGQTVRVGTGPALFAQADTEDVTGWVLPVNGGAPIIYRGEEVALVVTRIEPGYEEAITR